MDGEEEIQEICTGVPGGKPNEGCNDQKHDAFGGKSKKNGLSVSGAGPAARRLGAGVGGGRGGLGREQLFLSCAGKLPVCNRWRKLTHPDNCFPQR